MGKEILRVEVECVRVERSRADESYRVVSLRLVNARFVLRGGPDPGQPRGLLGVSRLQVAPVSGRRYLLKLEELEE